MVIFYSYVNVYQTVNGECSDLCLLHFQYSCTGMGNMDDVLFLGIKHVQTSTMGCQITVYQVISTNTNSID